jgi:hypothetical protein
MEAKLSAAEWLREEREAEVYIYEDSEGYILGPYCMNELQAQLEKCARTFVSPYRSGAHY